MTMDSLLILLVLVGLSVITSWLQKKRQAGEAESWPAGPRPSHPAPLPRRTSPPGVPSPAPPAAEAPSPTSRWEEELRRLLEGESPVSAPPPAPIVPKLEESSQRRVVAPPPLPPKPAPAVVRTVRPARPVPSLESMEPLEAAAAGLGRLDQSARAYERARQLHQAAAERLHQVETMTAQHRVGVAQGRRRTRPPEVAAAVNLLRHPTSARQAVVASLILGPPKGLD
jgi:hypothetical protein